jgi:hypothetical protein
MQDCCLSGFTDTGEFSGASPSLCTAVVEDPFASEWVAKPNLWSDVSVCDSTPCLLGGWVRTLKDL